MLFGGNDSIGCLNWGLAASVALPKLKPSTKTVSPRLPEGLLDSIKIESNKLDMSYQSLIKVWFSDNVKQSR
ncbi:MAG: CopG family antitoxin [Pseudomonadales bacterium]|nr:CopG family antitoxin [Pseudomonadales bacterium]